MSTEKELIYYELLVLRCRRRDAGADPTLGNVARRISRDGTPFIRVYPISTPVEMELKDIGKGRILGAVSLPAGAKSQDGKEKGVLQIPAAPRTHDALSSIRHRA